ncbi:hypothetical protein Tco_1116054, partial [Tanacetum coccineum]
MLDRTDFDSWQQRILLYCLGKDNGVNILMSIDEGPFKMGKFRETLAEGALHLGPERDRVFTDIAPEEKERYKAEIHAMNILLQGLPKYTYTLINHYTDTKDIWDNVKMLLEGSELTKDERESRLYDEFEHFRQNKGETIHEYYVRFVTAIKLNRGLKTSTYDQLYAYMKQHEALANENKMMLEIYNRHAIDPLAFVSNVSPQQYHTQSSAIPQSAYFKMAGLLFRMFRLDRTKVKGTMQGEKLQLEMGDFKTELAMQIMNSEYFKDKMLLMQAQENEFVLYEGQLLFIAGGQTNTLDDDVDEALVQDLSLNKDNIFQADQCDVFDSNVYEAPTAQTMFMANISSADSIYDEAGPSYDSDILFEYVKDNTVQVEQ